MARAEEFGLDTERFFGAYFAQVYECLPIEDFNDLLWEETKALYKKYNFCPAEHGDWVTLRGVYKLNPRANVSRLGQHYRPLNSWALKNPVSFVPIEEQLEEELEWTNMLFKALKKPELVMTLDKLQHDYVAEACEQMKNLQILLEMWVNKAGSPSSQDECFIGHSEEKRDFKRALKEQRLNLLDAKERWESVQKAAAPDFLIDLCHGNYQLETDTLNQIQNVMCMF